MGETLSDSGLPLQNENFDEKHKELVTSDIACINSILESERSNSSAGSSKGTRGAKK